MEGGRKGEDGGHGKEKDGERKVQIERENREEDKEKKERKGSGIEEGGGADGDAMKGQGG